MVDDPPPSRGTPKIQPFIRVVGRCGRAICGFCGAFGRTGGYDGAGFSGIFLAGDTASEGGHHADDQEQGQDFLERVVFH